MILLAASIALALAQDGSREDHTSLPELTYRCAPKAGAAFILIVEGTPKKSRTVIRGGQGWPETPILIMDGLRGVDTLHPEGVDVGVFRIEGKSGSDAYAMDLTLSFPKAPNNTADNFTADVTVKGPGEPVTAHCAMVASGSEA